ncbi:DUF4167 domain-containing protein [Sediminicoccus sp. KRV36]|uniref:DUF4167 domain-containing protein n=1 Tax=Sediminicoccus sp. KRV36 TaxID=3133721 RepID=UPI0020108192|nr:DUF4167 domain-containing protein [Sediminicoccus rosea]UPY35186.1 DUF4167 domain-containing protein [Sediminicoccus rosea]
MNMKRMRRGHRHGGGGGNGGGGGGQFRSAGGGSGGGSGNQPLNRNHVFDSSGPDVRLRGTAQQLFEKYLQLGRDATSGGDRVAAEGYFQHAEHYFRILGAMAAVQQQAQPQQDRRYREQGGESYQGENQANEGQEAQDGSGPASLEAELAGEAETLPMPQPRHVAPPAEDAAPETTSR